MVKEYLEKTRDEFYDSRQSLIEKLTTAENHYKENIKLIQMLEDSSDENYEAFTPREVNSYNKNKIREIKEEQNLIEPQLKTLHKQISDIDCKIVKVGTHSEVLPNVDGEICFSGPTVMIGYMNDTKETMQTLRKHEDGKIWLHTGDMGYKDNEGMVFFRQRLKRIIISSGYNLYPSYIESVIDKHPAVNASVVIGIDHPYKVQVYVPHFLNTLW